MRVAVLSASPKRQLSLTLQTVRTLQKMCPEDEFDITFIKDVSDHSDFEEKAKECDLILVLSSLYHFNVHGQLIAYLQGIQLPKGKPITYISTSGGNMDVPAHNFLRSFAKKNALLWIRSLSLLDEDILREIRREELYRWFSYVKDIVSQKALSKKSLEGVDVRILDAGDEAAFTEERAKALAERFRELGAKVTLINIRDKQIKGCIACFGCYTNNQCVIKDDFLSLYEEFEEGADVQIVVSNTNYNQFSARYKYYLDRHVMFGRFSHEKEYYKTYFCCGELSDSDLIELEQHTLVVDSLEANCLVGVYREEEMEKLVQETAFARIHELFPQRNTYIYGLSFQFANLAYRLQKMTPKDYEFFKERGYYDTPEMIPNVRAISNMEEGRMSCKMRLIQFEEMLAAVDGPPKLTHRGERVTVDISLGYEATGRAAAKAAEKKRDEKNGFRLFRKK